MASKNHAPTTARSITSRGGMSDTADPKLAIVFRLYEDLTNLLVLKARLEKSTFPTMEEAVFDCVYSAPATPADQGNSAWICSYVNGHALSLYF